MEIINFDLIINRPVLESVAIATSRITNNLIDRIEQAVVRASFTNYWTDRLWNLRTSIAGALYFNGELVGEGEDPAYRMITRNMQTRYMRAARIRPIKRTYKNPVYTDDVRGIKAERPWKGRYTGRQAAERALRDASRHLSRSGGYEVVYTVAMPYASSKYLYHRTTAVIETMLQTIGRGKMSKIKITTNYATF